jgi:hypothetical protein
VYGLAVALGFLALAGCAAAPLAPVSAEGPATGVSYAFFEKPSPVDPWTPKIKGWQLREQAQPSMEQLAAQPPAVSGNGRPSVPLHGESLRERYFRYRAESKRERARELAEWMQAVAKRHYVADGLIDHWATLEETLNRNGDDCDGLELLAYHFLRDNGFAENEVFRAVIYRPDDGQHHMVTLWFEDPQDPWVIDPTGAMTSGMPRMSERPKWVPLKLFTEKDQFTVRAIGGAGGSQLTWSGLPARR